MSIEMPKGLPFSVDTWSSSSKRKRHHFLTHAHKDHSTGISSHFSYPIYSTQLTKTVLQHYVKLDESLFVGIKVGQSVAIDEPDGAFTDTAFDANHCPVLDHSLAEVRSCSDFGQIKNPSLSPSILDPEAKALSDTETKQWRIKLSLFHSTREEQRSPTASLLHLSDDYPPPPAPPSRVASRTARTPRLWCLPHVSPLARPEPHRLRRLPHMSPLARPEPHRLRGLPSLTDRTHPLSIIEGISATPTSIPAETADSSIGTTPTPSPSAAVIHSDVPIMIEGLIGLVHSTKASSRTREDDQYYSSSSENYWTKRHYQQRLGLVIYNQMILCT